MYKRQGEIGLVGDGQPGFLTDKAAQDEGVLLPLHQIGKSAQSAKRRAQAGFLVDVSHMRCGAVAVEQIQLGAAVFPRHQEPGQGVDDGLSRRTVLVAGGAHHGEGGGAV